jgi:Tetratricopeptide repeat
MAQPRSRKPAPRLRPRTPVRAPAPPPVPDAPLAPAILWTLWGMIAALFATRAALTFEPSMEAWSLNLMRFLQPLLAWGLWALAALALVPRLARAVAPAWNAGGDAIARHPALATWAAFVLAVLVVGVWPDRVRFTGDFLLRQGTVDVAEQPSTLFPQALPLDVLLHYSVPRVLTDALSVDANGAARLLGMLEAGGLAALGIAFARTLGLAGGAAVVVASIVFFGGYLGMFTGFSKAFAEMCLLVAATGVYGLRVIRERRGLLPLALAFAIGVTLHRSALGLLPAVLYAWVVWGRARRPGTSWRQPRVIAALAIPILALAIMVPRILAIVRRWDASHFDPRVAGLSGSIWSAAFAGARAIDVVNLLLMLSPLAPALVVWVALARRRDAKIGHEAVLLLLLALPFLSLMPFIHPAQGLFRDWDDFAATGVALSLLVAWTIAQALRASPRHWLAPSLTLAVLAPSAQWLAHNADLERGLQRVRAFVLEPPPRAARERGTTWDYLGIRNFDIERWDAAAESFGHAASTSPSPRILQEWALAETMAGRYALAQKVYERLLAKQPDNSLGWLGLGQVSLHVHDLVEARRAAHQLLQMEPGNSDAKKVLEEADRIEAAMGQVPPAESRP